MSAWTLKSFSPEATQKMAALLVSHGALDALRKNRKLICRWLSAQPFILVGSPDNLRSWFTNHLLFCVRPRVCPRPSIPSNSPVYSHLRGLFRRDITLGASTFGHSKTSCTKPDLSISLQENLILEIAFDTAGIVGLHKWLNHAVILAKRESRKRSPGYDALREDHIGAVIRCDKYRAGPYASRKDYLRKSLKLAEDGLSVKFALNADQL